MRLLLDEMLDPDIAVELRRRGYDVAAVAERPDLRGQADAVVFVAAWAEGRCVVTENVGDYRPLAAEASRAGRPCPGLIFTSNRQFPRHDPRTLGRIVTALAHLLSQDRDLTNFKHWLS